MGYDLRVKRHILRNSLAVKHLHYEDTEAFWIEYFTFFDELSLKFEEFEIEDIVDKTEKKI